MIGHAQKVRRQGLAIKPGLKSNTNSNTSDDKVEVSEFDDTRLTQLVKESGLSVSGMLINVVIIMICILT